MHLSTTDHDKSLLRKFDSTIMLERMESDASSHVYLHHETAVPPVPKSRPSQSVPDEPETSVVALDVSIHFGRLTLVTGVVLTVLLVLTLVFHGGVELTRIDGDTSQTVKTKLLNQYNSYTGNLASMFGKPIEIFVTMAVQMMILRLLASILLRPQTSRRVDLLALVCSAGIGYLISNGFNALNVQLRPLQVEPMVSKADLSNVAFESIIPARSTNLNESFSEQTPRNPITNTVLRNLVLPRVPTVQALCDWKNSALAMGYNAVPDLVLDYGFAQRDWQSRVLQEAIEPKQLQLIVSPTNKTAINAVDFENLPMNASVAADLFLYSLLVGPSLFPWSMSLNAPIYQILKKSNSTDTLAYVSGLLPSIPSSIDETTQWKQLLAQSSNVLTKHLNYTKNLSTSDVLMNFSHVQISPTIHFDALTIELELLPSKFMQDINLQVPYECGPWPARCMMRKQRYTFRKEDPQYDPPAQVQAFGTCVNALGTEELRLVAEEFPDDFVDCQRISTSSMMIISVGKRFTAEALIQNKTINDTILSTGNSRYVAVAKNRRRFYTYTIAKLSWNLSDLSADFNAKCAEETCQGLRIPLNNVDTIPTKQHVIVGKDAIPLNLLQAPGFRVNVRFQPLVRLNEPSTVQIPGSAILYDACAGEPLLPHNIGDIVWDWNQPPSTDACSSFIEQRLQWILNNHIYIEHGLQTAYTAATFFLFQNGVVKDVISLDADRQTLNFQLNKQNIAVLASIPSQNTWLTLAGCFLLMGSLGSIILWAWLSSLKTTGVASCRDLGLVTTPHSVARVMLDSVHFPQFFLDRRVTFVGAETKGDLRAVDDFEIASLSLQKQQNSP